MSRALLYCTFNGIANCTNGIGRQAQTLLGALSRRWDELTALTGPFTPYVAIPEPGPATWAYDPTLLAESRQRGVREVFLDVRVDNDEAQRIYARAGFAAVGRQRFPQCSRWFAPARGECANVRRRSTTEP